MRLAVEIDGGYHQDQEAYDTYRTEVLADYGIKVIRYANDDIQYHLDGVIEEFKQQLQIREQEVL